MSPRLLLLLFTLLLPACAAGPPPLPAEDLAAPLEPVLAALPSLPADTPTPEPLPSASPTPTSTASPQPTQTSTPESEFVLCSPLSLHPLAQLTNIIGDPYRPPPPGREERHHGVDFAYYRFGDRDTMQGEPVQSILPGVVAMALEDRFPYGNTVIVETPLVNLPPELLETLEYSPDESLYVLYAHLNLPPAVSLGETVQACQLLGEVGLTGNTDVPHLHLETRIGPPGHVFESMLFYSTRATQQEMDNYVLWRTSGVFRHFDPMILLSAPTQE